MADLIGGGFCLWWRFCKQYQRIPPLAFRKFEHKIGCGGGSGDSGGSLRTKKVEKACYFLTSYGQSIRII